MQNPVPNVATVLTDNTTLMRGVRMALWFLFSTFALPMTEGLVHFFVSHPDTYSPYLVGSSMLILELLTSWLNPRLENH